MPLLQGATGNDGVTDTTDPPLLKATAMFTASGHVAALVGTSEYASENDVVEFMNSVTSDGALFARESVNVNGAPPSGTL